MDWATWVEAMEKERMQAEEDDRFRARSLEMNLSANIMMGIPDKYIIFFARQAEEVAKASDLTGEAPDTVCNFIKQHPGAFFDAMAAIMAGADLAPYRDGQIVK
jgi:hypothetical protein